MNSQALARTGRIIVGLVGVVLILAGVLKLANLGAEDMIEGLTKANLIQHKTLISLTAIVCGVLLLIPQTFRIGVLTSTAYWGGAIVAHLTYNDSVLMPAAFLGLMWIGCWLYGNVTIGPTSSARTGGNGDN